MKENLTNFKGRTFVISQLRADIVITDLDCVIELKTIARLTDKERNQILRYKKLSKCKYAILINFNKKLEIEFF